MPSYLPFQNIKLETPKEHYSLRPSPSNAAPRRRHRCRRHRRSIGARRGEVEFQLPLPISSQLSIQSLQLVSSGSQCCPKHKNVVFNFCQKYFGIFKRGVRQRHSFHLLKLKNTVQFAKKNWKNIYSKNTYLNYIMELSELVRTSDFCMIL